MSEPRCYRSTSLKLIEEHCPSALDHYEADEPYDRDVFQVGVAAHAVLQTVGERLADSAEVPDLDRIGDAVVRELVTNGRSFEGKPEAPMSVAAASAGRDLAVNYILGHELSPTARYEHGLAVDRDWRPVAYDAPDAWYRAAIDTFEVVEDTDDDGYTTTILVTTDWKSAWPTDATELDTVQLRGQAAVALAHFPDATVLRRRAVNLRTGVAFEVDVTVDDAGLATVAQWRRDIGHLVAVAETRGPDGTRPARPGTGCAGCPFLSRCEAARDFMRGSIFEDADATTMATQLAVADAFRKELWTWARGAAAEGNIEIEGGVVGFTEKAKREAVEDVALKLALAWFQPADPTDWAAKNGEILGLLKVLSLGVGSIESVAKVLFPANRSKENKALREQLAAKLTTSATSVEFGITRTKSPATPVTQEAAAK